MIETDPQSSTGAAIFTFKNTVIFSEMTELS